jgi:hypothetical protein
MYKMRAEHQSAGSRTTRIWHVLGHDGNALCCRVLDLDTAARASEDSRIPESYCTACLNAVTVTATTAPPRSPDPVIPPSPLPEEPSAQDPGPDGRTAV